MVLLIEKINDLMEKYNEFCRSNEADLIIHKTSELHKNKNKNMWNYIRNISKIII